MRERLLAAFVGLTLLTVMLYGVPRALVRADRVEEEAQRDLDRSAQVVAAVLDAGLPPAGLPLSFLEPGDQVVLRTGGRTDVLTGGELLGTGDGTLRATQELDGGGTLEVLRPRATVRQDVVQAVLPIVLTGLVALAVAVLAAVLLSARLARPFRLLAASASSLGSGAGSVDLPPMRVREAERIAGALRTSGARVAATLRREREFARNASHQLRTPLTAVRLRVEDLTLWPETPAAVRDELTEVLSEVDRLTETVASLLAFSRDERMTAWEEARPDELARAAGTRWEPLARAAGRAVHLEAGSDHPVPLPRVAVDQVLDVLVDNALKHGEGTVVVGSSIGAEQVRFVVRDEGSPGDGTDVFRRQRGSAAGGEGIGLSLCADLATALGGRLELVDRSPTTFELRLPVAGR